MAGTVKLTTGHSANHRAETALLLGTGYSARALIAPLHARGYRVIGTSREKTRAAETAAQLGIDVVVYNGGVEDELAHTLQQATMLLSSIPPHEGGDPFMADINHDFTRYAPHVSWAGYLSATSVYGDRAGQWAFEDELLRPATPRGHQRMAAEMDWLESGAPVHVFRLAGIYGPTLGGMARNPFKRLQSGAARAVIKPGHVVNRIHVDDIASLVLASIDRPNPVSIYNGADGVPAPPQDVINYAADILDMPRPPQIDYNDASLSDMARSFYGECKRIANDRARDELGWRPQYPDYRSGLKAILDAGG